MLKNILQDPKWRRFLLVTGGLVAVALVVLAAMAVFKPIRAAQLTKEALVLFEDDKIIEAKSKIMAASDLDRRNVTVAVAMAKIWARIAPTQVVPLWEYALTLAPQSSEVQQGLALACIAAGDTFKAKELIDALVKKNPSDPETIYVNCNYLAIAGRAPESLPAVIGLVERFPSNERYWLAYAALAHNLRGNTQEGYDRALNKLTSNKGNLGLWALREKVIMADAKELPAANEALLKHPQLNRESVLLTLVQERIKLKTSFEEIRKKAERIFDVSKTNERLALARFYRTIGDFDGVVNTIDAASAVKDRESLLVHLDGLAGQGHWTALLEILDFEKLPLENYWRDIFRARALASLKRGDEAKIAWRRALASAGSDSTALAEISQYLVMLGAYGSVEELMPRLIENANPLERSYYYSTWVRLALSSANAEHIQSLMERVATEYPKNSAYVNDYIYYSLLTNKSGDWVVKAYELAKASPAVLAHRVTLSLALLKAQQPAKALEVLETARLSDWSGVPTGWQVVRAAILKANGRAVPEVKGVESALPQEQALLK